MLSWSPNADISIPVSLWQSTRGFTRWSTWRNGYNWMVEMSSELSQISFARVDLRISASWCGLNLNSWSFSYQKRSESLATTNCSAWGEKGKV